MGQHLLDHVVKQIAVVAADKHGPAAKQACDVGLLAQRQYSQLQAGRPALGLSLQVHHHAVVRQRDGVQLQIGRRLFARKAQIRRTDLVQALLDAQPAQWPCRRASGDDQQAKPLRRAGHEAGHDLIDCRILHHVIVVQHEETGARLPQFVQFVTQGGRDHIQRRQARAAQEEQRLHAEIGRNGAQCVHDIGNEFRRFAVARIKLQPGGVDSAIVKPLTHQRTLPGAGRRNDQRQGAVPAGVEQVQEARSRQETGRTEWPVKLRLLNRVILAEHDDGHYHIVALRRQSPSGCGVRPRTMA
ncbi:MAG TPA: hypothetical protein P5333_22955 [Caldilinea sp.]|nr:hypothetical protein [Caldilinea sp.]